MSVSVRAPFGGTVLDIEHVPDPVFSARLVGPGLAIDPDRAPGAAVTVSAPVSGRITKLHPHAFVISTEGDRAVLVHLGIDTVTLAGEGFTLHAAEGAVVAAGDPMVTWCPSRIEAGGRSPVVPIIALDADPAALNLPREGATVTQGQTAFTWA